MTREILRWAAAVESRIPLLDDQLIEYAASIPSNVKIKPFQAKYLLKKAYADFLPQSILARKKMGFNVPTGTWFREEQRHIITQLLLSERTCSRGYFNNDVVARLLHDHMEGTTNYQAQLFILASLELWFRVFIDRADLTCPHESVEELLDEKVAIMK